MSVEQIAAVFGGAVLVIGSIGTMIGTLIVSLRTKQAVQADVKAVEEKFTEDAENKDQQLERIHLLVNSQLSTAIERMVASEEQLTEVRKVLTEVRQEVVDLREHIAHITGNPVDIRKAEEARVNVDAAKPDRESHD